LKGKNKFGLGLALVLLLPSAHADVLISTNGERFIGTIIEETTNTVVFDSELGGRLVLSSAQIRSLVRSVSNGTNGVSVPIVDATNSLVLPASTNLSWLPPGVGRDGADWLQLNSGEWLRGKLYYIQDKRVDFDSDELEEQSLKLKNVRQVYTGDRMLTQFEGQKPVYGRVVLSNDVVTVQGPETISLPRGELTGVTPGEGKAGLSLWSGKATVGLTLQSGNSHQTTITTSAELARRTPNTRLLLDYLGSYNEINGVQNVNNDRGNLTWDVWLNRDWFVRPIQFEIYHDSVANISYRLTGSIGAGYQIFDREGLKWSVAAGPAYLYTRFDTVESGAPDRASTPAGVLQTSLEYDLTRRLTFFQTVQATFTKRDAGQYTHHAVSTLEFEIKRHLNLDVSFIWDYLENPQPRSDGAIPEQSDYYLTVGLGVRF
jgi:Protein of unknown function, DUF481